MEWRAENMGTAWGISAELCSSPDCAKSIVSFSLLSPDITSNCTTWYSVEEFHTLLTAEEDSPPELRAIN